MNFNRITGISFILILTFSITACGNSKKNKNSIENTDVSDQTQFILLPDADTILDSWSKENVIINHWPADPDNLHPTNGTTASRSWVMQYTSNFLLRNDPVHLGICADIATGMPEVSDDNLQYTYTLRKDATWDDGTTITAEDVIFTYKANSCPVVNNPANKPYFENIQDIVADGNFKITMIMKREYIQNIAFVSDFPIMQRKYHDKNNVLMSYSFAQFSDPAFNADLHPDLTSWANEFNDVKYGSDITLLNGSGPYKVTSWDRGQSLIIERKKDHWSGKLKSPDIYETAFPEKIIFKIVRDPNAQKLEFRAQTIDVSVWLSTETTLELMQDPEFNKNYNVKFTDRYDYNYLGMNMRPDGSAHKKFFDDQKVRRAMAYLIPMDQMIEIVAHGYAKRQASCVSPLKSDYNSDLPLIPLDVEAAKKLLDEAGWKDTDGDNIRDKVIDGKKTQFSFELKYQSGLKFAEDIVKMIKESMYLAGVDVVLLAIEANTLREMLAKHDFDMYMGAWAGGAYPEDFAQLWHTSSYADGGSNFCGFGNAASDALIDSLKYTIDPEKRTPMVKRFQKMVYDEQPYIFMYASSRKVIIHKRFGNQYMTFEKPGVVLNNLRLLSLYGSKEE